MNGLIAGARCLLGSWACVLAIGTVSAGELSPELARRLDHSAPDASVGAIVRFEQDPTLTAAELGAPIATRRSELARRLKAKAQQAEQAARRLLVERGAEVPKSLWLIQAIAVEATPSVIRELADLPGVRSVSLDRSIRQPVVPANLRRFRISSAAVPGAGAPAMRGASTVEPNLAVVRAPELWALGFEGQGLVVAVLDSGVDPAHVDLISRWRDGSNSWFDPNGEYASPHDATGHGTQVTGLLVGGSSGGTAIGVAPGAEWIAAKIFDDQGEATFSAIHQSLAWVLDPDGDPETDDAPDVVNNSWGLTDDVGDCVLEFQTDIELLKAAGIAVVFAAGNEGPWPASSVSPANNPAGFAIGAVDNAWILESSTSRGPSACAEAVYPEIVAPGVLVWTSDITLGGVFPFSYVEASGTSFAAPHASGALTLLRQAFPAASVAMLEQALMLSAVDLGPAGPDGSYGYGAVDLVAAHAWLDAPTTCTDDDGDGAYEEGVGCGLLDCDDGNATAWHVPSEALGLRFDTDTRLVWAPPASPGGSLDSLRYDTLRTTTPDNFTGATCVATDDATSEAVDDPDVPGHAFYYLVRADNDCGDNLGSLGTDSSAVPRDGADCP